MSEHSNRFSAPPQSLTGEQDAGSGASRRDFLKVAGLGLSGAMLGSSGVAKSQAKASANGKTDGVAAGVRGPDTRIGKENQKQGSPHWGPAHNEAPEASFAVPVQGYTTKESVAPGEKLEFCVRAKQPYTIELYRIGWYGGAGGRKIATLEGSDPKIQPIPERDETDDRLVTCDWEVTDTVAVSDDWTSGVYYARFVPKEADPEQATVYPFIIREKEPTAHAVVQLPLNTLNAYNGWGGASLYGHTTAGDGPPGDAASYDRPYANPYSCHIGYALHLIRWLEREGYDVAYITNTDMDRDVDLISNYNLAMCTGHSEFWSVAQFRSFEKARNSGTNLAFVGGNIGMWSVIFRSDHYRTFDCDKDNSAIMFRNMGMEEEKLTGLKGSGAGLWRLPDLTVDKSALSHRWMQDTGFTAGDKVIGCVGHEWDYIADDTPENHTRFLHYEGGTSQWSKNGENPVSLGTDADTICYEAESGATVFHASVLGYGFRLDPDPSWDNAWPWSRVRDYKPGIDKPDPRLQTFQRNMFDELMTV